MTNQDALNVVIQDYFDIIGTFINTSVIVYYLFIVRFINIYTKEEKKTAVNVKVFKANSSKNGFGSSNYVNGLV